MLTLAEDKLDREELIKDLFALFDNFGNQNGRGLTMIINGKYGSGKSTLLDFIEEENNKEKKFNIIKYNSWENNIFDNPLIPILHTISKLKGKGAKIKDGAKNILKKIPSMFFATLANAHSVDIQALCSNENIFEEYDSYKNALTEFKKLLTEYCASKKTILLVDELDRCLPEYQIKVLESLYHLLDIPDLIVVIALDKQQLEYSIRNKFGYEQDTYGYLSKFIQYEVDLPEGDTYSYVKQLLTFSSEHNGDVKNVISNMFKGVELSIRECQILVKELNLICNEKDKKGAAVNYYYWYPMLVSFLLILKYTNRKIFKKYFGTIRSEENNWRAEKYSDNSLTNSRYNDFLNDIKNTKIEELIKFLQSNNYGQSFILHLINAFCPIRKISTESLAEYIKSDSSRVDAIINDFQTKMAYYPDTINKLIKKLQILK